MKHFIANLKELKTKDIIIALIIMALPFLFYLYLLVPQVEVWETDFFVINSYFYKNVNVYFWLLSTKFLLIFGLLIWFITCKNWWRNAIIIPIIIELYKLVTVVSADIYDVDVNEFIVTLPVTIPIIIVLFCLSKKLNYQSKKNLLIEGIDFEVNKILDDFYSTKKNDLEEINSMFKELKNMKGKVSKQEYLSNLKSLRNKLIMK